MNNIKKTLGNGYRKLLKLSKLESFIKAYAREVFEEEMDNLYHKYYYLERWNEAALRGEEKIPKLLDKGLQIYCYLDDYLSKKIFQDQFEQEELQLIRQVLRPGDSFLDIGANIGLFSILAAHIIGKSGTVESFEPSTETHQRLLENLSLNGFSWVETHAIALSNKREHASLAISQNGLGAFNSLTTPNVEGEFEYIQVQTDLLDKVVNWDQVYSAPYALLKIDVEGWEIPALKGAEIGLRHSSAPDLLVEFTEENARSAGSTCRELHELILDYGYQLFELQAGSKRLRQAPIRDYYPYQNLLATKNLERLWERLA